VLLTRNDRHVWLCNSIIRHALFAAQHFTAKISDSGKNSTPRSVFCYQKSG
jgi:hypothetical protein